MTTDESRRHVIVGTAGHIDHGKTSLVRRLTGIDTDRLPEEKARGISIDLGFAHWEAAEFRFGIVDVPGHERFVRNMVAGATGVNLALLVVAADDGLMPQTIEHLEIMDLLGVSGGVVAITKIDTVDADFVALVEAELVDRLRGTFLDGCPVVPVSSQTGEGFDRLTSALVAAARKSIPLRPGELFRMPIDRVFSVPGHGTVVTGSVLGGRVRVGESLELFPAQRLVRVRALQNHGQPVDESGSGSRTAINLAGVKVAELHRGDELANPGYLQPTRRLLVRLRCLSSAPVSLRDRMSLSLHLGTCEVSARVIVKGEPLAPGTEGYAELRTLTPIVAAYGQRFILRRPSPALTVAGGVVLDPGIEFRRRLPNLALRGAALDTADELERLSLFCSERDQVDASPLTAAWKVGVPPSHYAALIEQLETTRRLIRIGSREAAGLVHADALQSLKGAVLKRVHAELQQQHPRRALPRSVLLSACRRLGPSNLVEAAFELLLTAGTLVAVGPNFGPANMQVQLTRNQIATRAAMLGRITAGKLAPPTLRELAGALDQPPEAVSVLLDLCVEEGILVEVEEGIFFSPVALDQARQICRNLLAAHRSVTLSQLREAWGTTRRYALPLCQYFDARKITHRAGDVRRAGPNIAMSLVPPFS
jgi:selenocysteine-specific elongation factor